MWEGVPILFVIASAKFQTTRIFPSVRKVTGSEEEGERTRKTPLILAPIFSQQRPRASN